MIRLVLLTHLFFFGIAGGVAAQTNVPEPPLPSSLNSLVLQGAQPFYLGQYEGMNGWVIIRQGQPEFFYENADKTAVIMGLMFNQAGEIVTMAQLAALRERMGPAMDALVRDDLVVQQPQISTPTIAQNTTPTPPSAGNRPLTPAEIMYTDLLGANWITLNQAGAHDIIAFIDPDCPHCKELIRNAEPYFTPGGLRIRAILMGSRDTSVRKAAMMMASANPGEKLRLYAAGDESQITAPQNINTKAVESNIAVMAKHGFAVTPIIVYRTNKGEIRLVQGVPNNIDTIINDIVQN